MFEKFEILIIIIIILVVFYFVISLGAGKGKEPNSSAKIARYLFGVRILIALIAGRNLYSVLLISFVFASIMVGGVQLQLRLGIDSSFPYIVESVFVLSWLITRASKIDLKITNYILNKR